MIGKSGLRKTLEAVRSVVICGVTLGLLAGCAIQLWETIPEPVAEMVAERRANSLAGWDPALLNRGKLSSKLIRGTPMLVSSSADISIDWNLEPESPEDRESGVRTLSFSADLNLKAGESYGAAAAVANNGYFLTAGHVVDEPPMDLIALLRDENGNPKVRRAPVRVVWESGAFSREIDLAIIHADVDSLEAFELWDGVAATEAPIVTGGWPLLELKQGFDGSLVTAGRILSVAERGPRGNLPAYTIVQHDAPILEGDSGGPVLDRKGRLLGVNYKVTFDIPYWDLLAVLLGGDPDEIEAEDFAGEAIMPDPDWLREIIERDRRNRADDCQM